MDNHQHAVVLYCLLEMRFMIRNIAPDRRQRKVTQQILHYYGSISKIVNCEDSSNGYQSDAIANYLAETTPYVTLNKFWNHGVAIVT